MNRADFVGGVGLTLLGILMIFVIIPLSTEEGTYFGLSPTFFPTLLTVCLTICAVLLVLQSVLRSRANAPSPAVPISRWNLLMFALSAAIALAGIIAIDYFGILIGGPALIAGFMMFLGERHIFRLIVTSFVPVLLLYGLAIYVLGTPVP